MAPKKANAFLIFMLEYRKRAGKGLSMEEIQDVAGRIWDVSHYFTAYFLVIIFFCHCAANG